MELEVVVVELLQGWKLDLVQAVEGVGSAAVGGQVVSVDVLHTRAHSVRVLLRCVSLLLLLELEIKAACLGVVAHKPLLLLAMALPQSLLLLTLILLFLWVWLLLLFLLLAMPCERAQLHVLVLQLLLEGQKLVLLLQLLLLLVGGVGGGSDQAHVCVQGHDRTNCAVRC